MSRVASKIGGTTTHTFKVMYACTQIFRVVFRPKYLSIFVHARTGNSQRCLFAQGITCSSILILKRDSRVSRD